MTSKMQFNCKLAHCDEIKRVANFNSIKELYELVGQIFSISTNEILYCTINTHNYRNTNSLLANYLAPNDSIIVHLCGSSRNVSIRKTQEYIGLTITDNHNGRAFIKRIKPTDQLVDDLIKPGDHIAAINSQSMLGLRHFEVAKAIRAIPQDAIFTMTLIEPKYSSKNHLAIDLGLKKSIVEPEGTNRFKLNENNDANKREQHLDNVEISKTTTLLDCLNLGLCDDLINSSLPMEQLLSKRTFVRCEDDKGENSHRSIYQTTIEKMNSILESFLGIDDNLLAIRIYRLAHENKHSFEQFSSAIKRSELNVFHFNNEIQNHLWNCSNKIDVDI